jgi:hypothetical protein
MDSDSKIQVQLRDLMWSNQAIEALGLNPWCLNEGADGSAWYTITLGQAWEWGMIRK